MTEKPTLAGAQVIEAFVKTLPGQPGVYRMLNDAGDVLYVGKAKSLKKRVVAYTQPHKQSLRIQRMIAQTTHMEFAITHTEAEALLLEATLIKKLKPRYNILLRDDKSFPYILITADHDFPQVLKHRGAKTRKGEYFGPFASGLAVNEAIAVLHKAFMLRNCSDSIFSARTRPCLQFQIKRCTAPCVSRVKQEAYAKQVDLARAFLSGKSREIQEVFAREMMDASERMDFETAAALRDRIRALTSIQAHLVKGLDNADVLALYQHNGMSCVEVFFYRAGQNYGNRSYFPRHEKDDKPEDILSAFIAQFYLNKPVPKEILVNIPISAQDIIEQALKTHVIHPTRGNKKDLIDMAYKNAKEAYDRKRSIDATQAELLDGIAELFELESAPERIEVYDNSHISGTHALGAMIVVGPEGFQKNGYRKFNMDEVTKNAAGGDDFAMMRAMLSRRFKALVNDDAAPRPDLLLIDGGQGQLNAALQAMSDLGVSNIPVVGIAKGTEETGGGRNAGRERFFIPGKEPFRLEPTHPVLYFLQRIRDEAHRFAITSHRARRTRAMTTNPLDEIAGIGEKRKKALLLHFGSAKAVAEAGLADLQKVATISEAIAEKIYNFFHDGE
jgi:excinuclease ABC subunit C